jgi:hypothetical protein
MLSASELNQPLGKRRPQNSQKVKLKGPMKVMEVRTEEEKVGVEKFN